MVFSGLNILPTYDGEGDVLLTQEILTLIKKGLIYNVSCVYDDTYTLLRPHSHPLFWTGETVRRLGDQDTPLETQSTKFQRTVRNLNNSKDMNTCKHREPPILKVPVSPIVSLLLFRDCPFLLCQSPVCVRKRGGLRPLQRLTGLHSRRTFHEIITL